MNNIKGYTLIEVIISISLIIIICGISIISLKKNDNYSDITKSILKAASIYISNEKDSNGNTYEYGILHGSKGLQLSVDELIKKGYVDENYLQSLRKKYKTDNNLFLIQITNSISKKDEKECKNNLLEYNVNWENTTNTMYLCPYENEETENNNIKYTNITQAIMFNNPTFLNTDLINGPKLQKFAGNSGSLLFLINADNNYVEFAGKMWRIAITNPDGSAKIYLEDDIIPFTSLEINGKSQNIDPAETITCLGANTGTGGGSLNGTQKVTYNNNVDKYLEGCYLTKLTTSPESNKYLLEYEFWNKKLTNENEIKKIWNGPRMITLEETYKSLIKDSNLDEFVEEQNWSYIGDCTGDFGSVDAGGKNYYDCYKLDMSDIKYDILKGYQLTAMYNVPTSTLYNIDFVQQGGFMGYSIGENITNSSYLYDEMNINKFTKLTLGGYRTVVYDGNNNGKIESSGIGVCKGKNPTIDCELGDTANDLIIFHGKQEYINYKYKFTINLKSDLCYTGNGSKENPYKPEKC